MKKIDRLSFSDCQLEAKKYQNRNSFRKNSNRHYLKSYTQKWLDLICGHMLSFSEVMRQLKTKWTFEICLAEAKKHQTAQEFRTLSNLAYEAARTHNWLKEIYSQVNFKNSQSTKPSTPKWTLYECLVEAKKYQNRSEFSTNNPEMYQYAIAKRYLNKITQHMPSVNLKIKKNPLKQVVI